jgi:tetratricopeptide (TPR) repeat protein
MLTYLRLLAYPVGQTLDYDYPVYQSLFAPAVLVGLAVTAGLLAAAVACAKRYPLLAFAALWFFTALSVESSLIPISDVIFEHRLYLPMAGYSLFCVGLLVYFGGRMRARLATAVACALVLCLGLSAFMRNEVWRQKCRILNDNVAKAPHKARPVDYRGDFWAAAGWYDLALRDYTTAIAADPSYWKAYYNRGTLLALTGRRRQALADLDRAIALAPDYPNAYRNKANALSDLGMPDSAIAYYNRALSLDTADAATYGNRGLAYLRKGEPLPALADCDRALRLDPGLQFVRLNRGLALNALRRYDEAVRDFDQNLYSSPHPAGALAGRAWALFKLRRYDEARRDHQRLMDLKQAVPREYREMQAYFEKHK